MGVTCKVIKDYGYFAKSDKAEMRLKQISWNGGKPVMDARIWIDEKTARSGVTMTFKELKKLGKLIEQVRNGEDKENSTNLPAEEDDDEVVILPTPKKTIKAKTTKAAKTTAAKETKSIKTSKTKKEEFQLIEVLEYDEDYEQAETDTDYSLADAKNKLDEIFKSKTSEEYKYIKEKLYEELQANEQFIQNFMREEKTLDGAGMYLVKKAREKGQAVALKDDAIVAIMIEYFDIDEVS